MVLILFAISVLTFLIFNVIPAGGADGTALRIAGRNSNEVTREAIKKEWGLDKPVYVQYAKPREKVSTGDLISYPNQLNVRDELIRGFPATASLVIGAAVVWVFFGVLFGLLSAVFAGRWLDRLLTVVSRSEEHTSELQ